MAEAKIEVLEYVELIGSASQSGNNSMCSICKRKMQIIFRVLVIKKEVGKTTLPAWHHSQSSKSSHH